MPFLHAAFCFGHGAFAVWSCGVLKSSWGVLPPYREGQRPRCPIRRCTGQWFGSGWDIVKYAKKPNEIAPKRRMKSRQNAEQIVLCF
jgi:hypothetical protein